MQTVTVAPRKLVSSQPQAAYSDYIASNKDYLFSC